MDDSNSAKENNPPTSSPLKNRISFLLIGSGAGIVFLLTIFLILNYFNSISLSTLYPKQLGWLPHRSTTKYKINLGKFAAFLPTQPTSKPIQKVETPSVYSSVLDSCLLSKEGNPLVEILTKQAGIVRGNFKGTIVNLQKDRVRQSYIIKLKSLDNAQEYNFNIIDKENFVINLKEKGTTSMSALKTSQTIQIFFVCNSKTNLLDFNKIYILPNATTATPSAAKK